MKCKTLAGVGILTVFFLLVAGWLSPGFADDVTRSGESPRAIELAARAPKTPEEFLRLVREWMDDPYMDGYEFAERITGVGREKWGPFDTAWGRLDFGPAYYMKNNGIYPPVPYQVISIQITQDTGHLWDTIIPFPDDKFCVSAEMVKKILGEPSKVSRKMPNKFSEKVPDYTPVIYFRYKNNKYKLKVRFSFPESRFGNILKLPIEKQKEIYSYIKKTENERYICASMIRFGTYEGRK